MATLHRVVAEEHPLPESDQRDREEEGEDEEDHPPHPTGSLDWHAGSLGEGWLLRARSHLVASVLLRPGSRFGEILVRLEIDEGEERVDVGGSGGRRRSRGHCTTLTLL